MLILGKRVTVLHAADQDAADVDAWALEDMVRYVQMLP